MKQQFILAHSIARNRAIEAVKNAPNGYSVKIQPQTRSLDQNAKLWPMLSDVSNQVLWPVDGEMVKLSEDDWKDLFTAALRKHNRMAKGLDGGIVMLGNKTSKMSKEEFSMLIELIYSFGAEHGVEWME